MLLPLAPRSNVETQLAVARGRGRGRGWATALNGGTRGEAPPPPPPPLPAAASGRFPCQQNGGESGEGADGVSEGGVGLGDLIWQDDEEEVVGWRGEGEEWWRQQREARRKEELRAEEALWPCPLFAPRHYEDQADAGIPALSPPPRSPSPSPCPLPPSPPPSPLPLHVPSFHLLSPSGCLIPPPCESANHRESLFIIMASPPPPLPLALISRSYRGEGG